MVSCSPFQFNLPPSTAPITTNSSQVCTGLNADLLDGFHASEFARLTGAAFTGAVTITNNLNVRGEMYVASATTAVHDGNVEKWWQAAARTQAFFHTGTSTVLEIEAVVTSSSYGGVTRRTVWTVVTRGAVTVLRENFNGGVGILARLRVVQDLSVTDGASLNRYVVGLLCGESTGFRLVYMRARYLHLGTDSRWTTFTALANLNAAPNPASAMTGESGVWNAAPGYSDATAAEIVSDYWSSTNQGPGTGMNADLLDGKHASEFIDTSSTSQTKLGAIRLGGGSNGRIDVVPGNSTNPGYAAFFTPDGTRRGYLGWQGAAGRLNIQSENSWNWEFNQTPLVAGNSIWHAGNDGPGTGLDADLLDGFQAADFLRGFTTTFRVWTSADTNLASFFPGASQFGTIWESDPNGQMVLGLRNNDLNDTFTILSKGSNTSTSHGAVPYSTLCFRVRSNGDTYIATKLGIGTLTPASSDGLGQVLHISGNFRNEVRLSTASQAILRLGASGVGYLGTENGRDLLLQTFSVTRLTISGTTGIANFEVGPTVGVSAWLIWHAGNLTGSLTGSGGNLGLVGDLLSPGNSRYYGTNASGVKGWYVLPSGGSGDVPSTRLIATTGSLQGGGNLSADRTLSLVGDNASPGALRYYGTDGASAKGFHTFPAFALQAVTITGVTSLTGGGNLTANRTLSLVGDVASPGNSAYYGTNSVGTKGWFALPNAALQTTTITGILSLTGGGSLAANRTISLLNDDAAPGNLRYYGTSAAGVKGWHAFPFAFQSTQIATVGSLTGGGDLSGSRNLSLVGDVGSPGATRYYGTNGAGTKGWYVIPPSEVPAARAVNTTHSLAGGGNLSADRTLSLLNDEASPGNLRYYGTSNVGTKGWHAFPFAFQSTQIATTGSLTGGGNLSGSRTLFLVGDVTSPGASRYYGTNSGGTKGFHVIPPSEVPAARLVSTSGSLTGGGNLSADRTLSLVNDNASPGNSRYYGTNSSGTKGFHVLPAGGAGNVHEFVLTGFTGDLLGGEHVVFEVNLAGAKQGDFVHACIKWVDGPDPQEWLFWARVHAIAGRESATYTPSVGKVLISILNCTEIGSGFTLGAPTSVTVTLVHVPV